MADNLLLLARVRAAVVIVGLVGLASCVEPANDAGPTGSSRIARVRVPLVPPRRIDLLFVIDTSPAMAAHQAVIRENARYFAATLQTLGYSPDLHIAVVTTDLGTQDGTGAVPRPGCTARGDDAQLRVAPGMHERFLAEHRADDGTVARNFDGTLADRLAELLDAGSDGCAYTRPLEAMRRALERPEHAGFRRRDARFQVVFVTAGDDCSFRSARLLDEVPAAGCALHDESLVPVDDYARFLRRHAAGQPLIVSAIAGPAEPFVVLGDRPAPSCAARGRELARGTWPAERTALPAVRLGRLLDRFEHQAVAVSICGVDLSEVLAGHGELLRSLGNPCFGVQLADIDPVQPGVQRDCVAWLERFGRSTRVEAPLPPCGEADAAGAECYRIIDEPIACPPSVHVPAERASSEMLVLPEALARGQGTHAVTVECVAR